MASSFEQRLTGMMTYPARGTWNRFVFKLPIIWWRLGLRPRLGHFICLITTWGRRSKLPRHTMLTYGREGATIYLLAGWGARSDWYQNMVANPRVTVQVNDVTYYARARRVTDAAEFTQQLRVVFQTGGDAYFRPWLESLGIAYDLDDAVAKRDRIYLVALDPSDEPGPPPMPVDLAWVWWVIGASFAAGWLLGRLARTRAHEG